MEKDQEKKILLIKIFVIGLGILIFIVWGINLKYVWRENKNAPTSNQEDFSKLKADFNDSVKEMQQRFDSINKEENQKNSEKGQALLSDVLQGAKNISSSTNTAITAIGTVTPLLASSSTSLSTSTPHLNEAINSCPEYINCMPTIGETRPCQVPAGCEGKTIIAY